MFEDFRISLTAIRKCTECSISDTLLFFSIVLFSATYIFGTHLVYINNVNNMPVRF